MKSEKFNLRFLLKVYVPIIKRHEMFPNVNKAEKKGVAFVSCRHHL